MVRPLERPIFTLLGLFWLLTIPFESGILALRWTLGILFLILGVWTTTNYIRVRRSRATPTHWRNRPEREPLNAAPEVPGYRRAPTSRGARPGGFRPGRHKQPTPDGSMEQ